MTWNYRILHFDDEDTPHFKIMEVYYNNDESVRFYGDLFPHSDETPEALIKTLEEMQLDCTNQSVLKVSELKKQINAHASTTGTEYTLAELRAMPDLFSGEIDDQSQKGSHDDE